MRLNPLHETRRLGMRPRASSMRSARRGCRGGRVPKSDRTALRRKGRLVYVRRKGRLLSVEPTGPGQAAPRRRRSPAALASFRVAPPVRVAPRPSRLPTSDKEACEQVACSPRRGRDAADTAPLPRLVGQQAGTEAGCVPWLPPWPPGRGLLGADGSRRRTGRQHGQGGVRYRTVLTCRRGGDDVWAQDNEKIRTREAFRLGVSSISCMAEEGAVT